MSAYSLKMLFLLQKTITWAEYLIPNVLIAMLLVIIAYTFAKCAASPMKHFAMETGGLMERFLGAPFIAVFLGLPMVLAILHSLVSFCVIGLGFKAWDPIVVWRVRFCLFVVVFMALAWVLAKPRLQHWAMHLASGSHDGYAILFVSVLSIFLIFNPWSIDFGWNVFHERDFSRTANFVLNRQLSHLGPEIGGGGFLPGPFLTLMYSIPTFLTLSPRGIHALIQLSFVASIAVAFLLVKTYFTRTIAYLTVLILMTSQTFLSFSYAGWHSSLILFFETVGLFICHHAMAADRKRYFFLVGLWIGVGFQTHISIGIHFLVYLAFGLLFLRNPILKRLGITFLGFCATLSYYAYHEFGNHFRYLANSWKSRPLRPQSQTALWNAYESNVLYTGAAIFSLCCVVIGLVLLYRNRKSADVSKFVLPTIFLCLQISIALFSTGMKRHFLITHPAFEILFAMSLELIYANIQHHDRLARFFKTGVASIFIMSMLLTLLSPGQLESSLPKYRSFKHVLDYLLEDLRLTPEEYENRFYLFRGTRNWSLDPHLMQPSLSHYTLVWQHQKPLVTHDHSAESGKSYGIILTATRERSLLDTTFLSILSEQKGREFTSILYKSPYIYRQAKQYNELSPEEEQIRNRTISPHRERDAEHLYYEHLFKYTGLIKPLGYLHRVVLRRQNNDLVGFSEIVGPDLRQVEHREESPYFIRSPALLLTFRDGKQKLFPLLQNNLYSKTAAYTFASFTNRLYERYGQLNDSINLGNYYVETPYGRPILLADRKLQDIESITFINEGFGSILADPKDEHFMRNQETVLLAR